MTDGIIGASIALVLVALVMVSGIAVAVRRFVRWIKVEFHL